MLMPFADSRNEIRHPTGRYARTTAGFTLIELIITVLVLAIMLAFAVPNWVPFIQGNRLAAAQSDFMSSLAYARSEAARANLTVHMTPGAPPGFSTDFATGWTVWMDNNNSGAWAAGDTLRTHSALTKVTAAMATPGEIVFAPTGFLSAGVPTRVTLCDADVLTNTYQINVLVSGATVAIKNQPCA